MRPLHAFPVLLLATAAHAAEVTDMPPALRGDIEVDYLGAFQSGSLEEAGEKWGGRRYVEHDVRIGLRFAPIDGLAFLVDLPMTASWKLSYTDGYAMEYDPVSGTGTYTSGADLGEDPSYSGGGIDGVWLGAAIQPFSEHYARNQQTTWRIDAGFRTASGRTRWSAQDGRRGAAPGGMAFRFGAAFSTQNGIANPYLDFDVVLEAPTTVEVVDEEGTVLNPDARIKPASQVDVTGGVEVLSMDNAQTGMRMMVDLFTGFGYRGWEDVPSGLFLPDVLEASEDLVVTHSEHLYARGGLGLRYIVNDYVEMRLAGDARYIQPHRLENVYPVRTSADTFQVGWTFGITGKIR